ncbi:MAG: ABC transporter ATP-binding protein [Bacillota bacterium]|nr:ABC transporter ATP-binding protein [Bacillota bacterium]
MSLKVENLSFAYEKKAVFENISLEVNSGEIVCVLGPNGTGKTTLFKNILGLYKPHSGQVFVDSREISGCTRRERAQIMAYVPQNHVPPFPYLVMDVILMGRTAHINHYALPSEVDRQIAREAMREMNISHLEKKYYTELSGGERQLVLIARALAQKPRILIMDEPTSSLDYGNQVRLLDHIKILAEQGLAIMMSLHYPDHALYCAGKVIMMKDGKILCQGNAKQVVTEDYLQELYGIDVEIVETRAKNGHNRLICVPGVA